MPPFDLVRARDTGAALALRAQAPGAAWLAGGTDLLPLWKAGLAEPALMIDISGAIPSDILREDDVTVIGAGARLAEIADHGDVRRHHRALVLAIEASASAQVRNLATLGGALMQRTRCAYFRGGITPCEKLAPGSGCAARSGHNRLHAIFGGGGPCVAVHASDAAVALLALDAEVRLASPRDRRTIPLDGFHRPDPVRETVLAADELILEIAAPLLGGASTYVKVCDRQSFEFAVISVAARLEVSAGRVRQVAVAAGGVAATPIRLAAVEAALIGEAANEAAFRRAADRAADGAQPLSGNGFKTELLKRAVCRALFDLGGLA